MTKILITLVFTFAALVMAGCGGPTGNTPANGTNANSNANANKTTAAAPTAEMLMALDKQAHTEYFKGNGKHFEDILSDKFVGFDGSGKMGKADLVKMMDSVKCDVKEGWTLDDPQMAKIDDTTYAVSYKVTVDGSCTGPDGKSMKIPSPARAATIWTKSGDKWHAAFHGETAIMTPGAPPPAPPPADSHKEAPAASNSNAANAAPSRISTANTS